MPSNQTTNYHLNQWEPEDAVRRVDFNEDNEKIDAAIKAVDVRVDGKADTSALNDLKQTVNTLSGTVTAQGSALSGHDSSLTKLGNCQVYTTSYTGNGEQTKTLSFPGYPVHVYIRCPNHTDGMTFFRGLVAGDAYTYSVQWLDRGITVSEPSSTAYRINGNTLNYFVFALLDKSK